MISDVTIGILAFNEEYGIEKAIRSAAGQCERLIVSDNASTDRTGEICSSLLKEFPNLEYYRQPENVGSYKNGHFILSLVKTKDFMFLGAHDYLGSDYVQTLKDLLDASPDAVLAGGKYIPFRRDGSYCQPPAPMPAGNLDSESPFRRVEFIAKDGIPKEGCFIANGLHRTDLLRNALSYSSTKCGGDILFIANEALSGKIMLCDKAEYYFETRTEDSQQAYFRRLTNKDLDISFIHKERSEYAEAMFDIALKAAFGNPAYALRLMRIRLHLSVNYGYFKRKTFFDFIPCFTIRIIGGLFKKQLQVPGSNTILEDTLLKIAKQKILEGQRIALYGAGMHTQRFLCAGIISPENIVAVFDDSPKLEFIAGVPVFPVGKAGEISFDILIISTDTVQDILLKKAQKWLRSNIKILRLYPLKIYR